MKLIEKIDEILDEQVEDVQTVRDLSSLYKKVKGMNDIVWVLLKNEKDEKQKMRLKTLVSFIQGILQDIMTITKKVK